jgi:hypothetical protein
MPSERNLIIAPVSFFRFSLWIVLTGKAQTSEDWDHLHRKKFSGAQ